MSLRVIRRRGRTSVRNEWECPYCGRGYSYHGTLDKHMHEQHGVRTGQHWPKARYEYLRDRKVAKEHGLRRRRKA